MFWWIVGRQQYCTRTNFVSGSDIVGRPNHIGSA